MEYFCHFRDFQKSFVGRLKVGSISKGQKNSKKYLFVAYFEKKALQKVVAKSPKSG